MATQARSSIAFLRAGADQSHRARPRRRHPHHRRPHAFVDAATTAFATAATVLITTAVVAALTAPRRDYTTHEGAGAAKNDQAQEGAGPRAVPDTPPTRAAAPTMPSPTTP